MQLGMIGLGRMGANIVRRLMRQGHECVVYDRSADAVKASVAQGAKGASTLAELVAGLVPVSPGLVPVTEWRPAADPRFDPAASVPVYGIVARKP